MRIISGFLGRILMVTAAILLVPALFSALSGENSCLLPFLLTSGCSAAVGALLYYTRKDGSPSVAQAMVICSLSWIVLSLAGAAPFVLTLGASPVDAVFESMSGFTTTGITMFTGLDSMPRTILLWRSITQWVGGLGILTFFMAVASKVPGAHRLISAESHKIFSGRPVPGLFHTVKILWTIYGGITIAIAAGYLLCGMNLFDSLNHAMTTISTGGFSTHDLSMGYYAATGTGNAVPMEYISIAGMAAGGISFLVHYRVFRRDGLKALFSGDEIRLFWVLTAGFTGIILLEQAVSSQVYLSSLEAAFRTDLFQVTSILTTTGFATADINGSFFGAAAGQLFLTMMVIGGCVGSTSGGIKVLRVSILLSMAKEELAGLFRSHRAISGTRFQGRLLGREELSRIAAIVFIWFVLLLAGGLVTTLLAPELSAYAAFSGMFSALGNIGPCYITQQGLMELHWFIKITYIIGMLAGRLEILPVMLLFSARAWR